MNPRAVLGLLPLVLTTLTSMAQWVETPPGGLSLLDSSALRVGLSSGGVASWGEIEVTGMPFQRALRVDVTTPGTVAWGVQVQTSTVGDVGRGDVLWMMLFVRGYCPANESGEARGTAYLQQAQAPNTKVGTLGVSAGLEWRQLMLPFRSDLALTQGQHNFTLHMGQYVQWLEIGGLAIFNYRDTRTIAELPRTKATYQGREPGAPWRAEAAARIDRHRKGDLEVVVRDAAGQPVAGARIHVALRRHAFGFGSAVTAQMLNAESRDGWTYRFMVERYFNKVVFENDLKWPPWETAKSNTNSTYRRVWLDAAIAWLAERDIKIRGHYGSWAPLDTADGRGPGMGPLEDLKERLFLHQAEKLPAIGNKVVEWDAINHIAGWGTRLENLYGPGIYADIIRHTRSLAPGVQMWVNEGNILPGGGRRDEYQRLIKYLIENGAAPDGLGMMAHFDEGSLTGMEECYAVMNRFASLLGNLQLTELDVNTLDEQLQADYLRDIMTLAFSHPAYSGIVMWGFWQGRHWKPDAALWRQDWSAKPAALAWLDLVFGTWWTDQELTTGPEGLGSTRGFLGDYTITVSHEGRKRTVQALLTAAGARVEVVLPKTVRRRTT